MLYIHESLLAILVPQDLLSGLLSPEGGFKVRVNDIIVSLVEVTHLLWLPELFKMHIHDGILQDSLRLSFLIESRE